MAKDTVEETPRLDSEDLRPGEGWQVITIHNARGRCLDSFVDQNDDGMTALLTAVGGCRDRPAWEIRLGETTGMFPKIRYICPECGKVRRFLYFDGKAGFACRWCCGLNYHVQQKKRDCTEFFYLGLKFAKDNLKWTPPPGSVPADFPYMTPTKPPRMTKQNYDKALKRFRHYQKQYKDAAADELYAIMGKRLGVTKEEFKRMGDIF